MAGLESQLETSAGPCGAHPITHFHLHCGLPIGHKGLHRCFAAVTWGDYSAIQLDGVALEQLTPDECKALRLAAIFGKPDKPHDVLEAAIEKLHRIERAASVGASGEHTPRGPSGDSVSFPLTNTVEDEERASWADREPDDPPS